MTTKKNRKHLIIGCGTAALSALRKIRNCGCTDEVKLVTMENHAPYSPTSLPYLLAGRIPEDKLWLAGAAFFKAMQAEVATGKKVASVDPAGKKVVYADRSTEEFTTLLIATGAEPVNPSIPGLEAAGFQGFRTLDDCQKLSTRISEKRDVVILGGGLVGMQLAVSLAEKGCAVTILEKEHQVLPAYFDSETSSLIRAIFEQKGVTILTGTEATGVSRDRQNRLTITLQGGPPVSADTLITATGMTPRTSFLEGSGIRIARGVLVDRKMQTSIPDIYAAGDVAEAADFFTGQPELNPILPSAVLQGKIAGASMAGQKLEYEGGIAMNVFNFFENTACSVGLATASGNGFQFLAEKDEKRRTLKKLVFKDGRLQGAIFLNVDVEPGLFVYLIRKRLSIAPYEELLLNKPRETARWLMLSAESAQGVPLYTGATGRGAAESLQGVALQRDCHE